jgi:hypothetical protein
MPITPQDVTVKVHADTRAAQRSLRQVRRSAFATGTVIAHPLLILVALVVSALVSGVLLGLLIA